MQTGQLMLVEEHQEVVFLAWKRLDPIWNLICDPDTTIEMDAINTWINLPTTR